MKFIHRIKSKLATIRKTSWRYRIVHSIWDNPTRIRNAKACSFYWWYLPSSIFVIIMGGIAIVLWTIVGYLIVAPISWVIGRPMDKNIYDPDWAEYRYDPKHDKTKKIVPWYFILPIVLIVGISTLNLTVGIPWLLVGEIVAGILIVAVLGTGIGFLITNPSVQETWSKMCPNLKVVEEKN